MLVVGFTKVQSFHGDAILGPGKPEVQRCAGCWCESFASVDGRVELAAQGRWFCMKILVTNENKMSRTCALRRECLEFK